ncbi:hypothetical protein [Streptomyces sp. NRRL S-146]
MTGTGIILRLLHDGERDLEQDLLAAAARHPGRRPRKPSAGVPRPDCSC